MANLVDARTWVVDNLVVNSALILAPGSTSSGSITLTSETLTTLTVTGASTLSGNVTTAGQLLGANGTNLLPTYSFTGAAASGFYNQAGVGPSITAGGARIFSVTATTVNIVTGTLSFGDAVSKIIPGATSISLRNNADTLDNLLITDAGNATIRGNLVVSGTGPSAIGVAVDSRIGLRINTAATVVGTVGAGVEIAPALTAAANNDILAALSLGTFLTNTSVAKGTFTGLDVAEVLIGANSITATGAGTILNASSLKIGGAPTVGTNNYSMWIAAGGIVMGAGATPITTLTNKAGSAAGDYTTTSAAYVDVDATNLAYAITVPTGFKMHISANANVKGTGLASIISFAITDGTTLLAEELVEVAVAGDREAVAVHHVFTGAGAASTFKLRWAVSTGTATMGNSTATLSPRITFFMAPSA